MAPVPVFSPEALEWAVKSFKDKTLRDRYKRYTDYYNGEHDLEFATEKFRKAFQNLFEAFAYNRCAAVVDAMTDRLTVERFAAGSREPKPGLAAGETPPLSSEPKPENPVVDTAMAIWRRCRMDARQDEVWQESKTTGDGFLIVWQDPMTGEATIWPQEACHMRVRYDEEVPGLAILAAKGWNVEKRMRLNIYGPDGIARYVTDKPMGAAPIQPNHFVPFTGDGAGPFIDNPWGVLPVFHFPNKARTGQMGRSELADVIPIQNALNKTLADQMIAEEFAAWPQKVLMGVEVDPDIHTSSDPARGVVNDDNIKRFSLGVDRILALASDVAKIGEFSAAQLEQFDKLAESWDARISRVTKVPVHYLTLSGDFPSGRALRTAEAPFVAKLENDQDTHGPTMAAAIALACQIEGTDVPDDFEAVWSSAAPLAEEDKLDIVKQKVDVGFPLDVALKEAGWSEEAIAEIMAAKQAVEDRQIEIEAETFKAGRMPGDGPIG